MRTASDLDGLLAVHTDTRSIQISAGPFPKEILLSFLFCLKWINFVFYSLFWVLFTWQQTSKLVSSCNNRFIKPNCFQDFFLFALKFKLQYDFVWLGGRPEIDFNVTSLIFPIKNLTELYEQQLVIVILTSRFPLPLAQPYTQKQQQRETNFS